MIGVPNTPANLASAIAAGDARAQAAWEDEHRDPTPEEEREVIEAGGITYDDLVAAWDAGHKAGWDDRFHYDHDPDYAGPMRNPWA